MDHEKPTGPGRNLPASGSDADLAHNPSVDDFFRRLKQDLHQPKPGNESIAAALQAVQRLASQVDTDASASAAAEIAVSRTCLSCGSSNPVENRFCAICGVPQQDAPAREPEVRTRSRLKASAATGWAASLSSSLSSPLFFVSRGRRSARRLRAASNQWRSGRPRCSRPRSSRRWSFVDPGRDCGPQTYAGLDAGL